LAFTRLFVRDVRIYTQSFLHILQILDELLVTCSFHLLHTHHQFKRELCACSTLLADITKRSSHDRSFRIYTVVPYTVILYPPKFRSILTFHFPTTFLPHAFNSTPPSLFSMKLTPFQPVETTYSFANARVLAVTSTSAMMRDFGGRVSRLRARDVALMGGIMEPRMV
jgi:hypothetical protein